MTMKQKANCNLFRSGLKNDWIPAIDSWFDEIKMFPPTAVKK